MRIRIVVITAIIGPGVVTSSIISRGIIGRGIVSVVQSLCE